MITPPMLQDCPSECTVLVVDDDEKNRRLLCDLLGAHGYRVAEACDAEAALRCIDDDPPDAILLDVMMPTMDGFDLCRKLQADPSTAPIPVLLVTALHERADRLRGVASGAIDFITKPIDTAEVLLRVRNVLRTKRLFDQRETLLCLRENLSDMIVHDIRNPLLAITLSARRIEGSCSSTEIARLAGEILDQAQLLERFIADLLTVSRLEQGALELQLTREDLAELGSAAFRSHRIQADARRIRLELICRGDCAADVDRNLFTRLLDNLISNAIKFAPEGTSVTLKIQPSDSGSARHRIHVEDEGPGIPLGYRNTIFDKYAILKSDDPDLPQTGLGLALCRMVAEAHGGRIFVEPREPRGSVFTVELP